MMTHLRCGLFLMVIYFSIASFGNDNGQIQVEAINMVYSNIVQRLDYEYRGPYDARSLGDKVFSLDYSSAFKRMIVFLNRDLHIKTTDPRLFNITIEFQTDNLLIYSLGVVWDNERGNPSYLGLYFDSNNQIVPMSKTNTVHYSRKDKSDLELPNWVFEMKQGVAPFMRNNTCWVLEVDTESQAFAWDPLDLSVNTNVCKTLNSIADVFSGYDLQYLYFKHRPIDSSLWVCTVSLVKRGHDHDIIDRYEIAIDGDGRIIHPIPKSESDMANGRASGKSDRERESQEGEG